MSAAIVALPASEGSRPVRFAVEAGGEVIGHLSVFDDKLVDALHAIGCLLRSPEALANLLEAAGGVGLERAGAVLVGRVDQELVDWRAWRPAEADRQ